MLYGQSEGQWLWLICSAPNWHLWLFYFAGADRGWTVRDDLIKISVKGVWEWQAWETPMPLGLCISKNLVIRYISRYRGLGNCRDRNTSTAQTAQNVPNTRESCSRAATLPPDAPMWRIFTQDAAILYDLFIFKYQYSVFENRYSIAKQNIAILMSINIFLHPYMPLHDQNSSNLDIIS